MDIIDEIIGELKLPELVEVLHKVSDEILLRMMQDADSGILESQ